MLTMRLLSLLSLVVPLVVEALALPAIRHISDPAAAATGAARGEQHLGGLAERQTGSSINTLLSAIVSLFPVGIAVADVTDGIALAEQALALALHIDTTENGLGADCAGMTILFARGTTEAGNVGAIAGPPFFDAVRRRLGSGATLAVQGVDYPADIPGFLAGGDGQGSQTMYLSTPTLPGSNLGRNELTGESAGPTSSTRPSRTAQTPRS